MPDEKFDEKELEKREEKSPEEKSWDEKWQRDPLNTIAWAAILIWAGIVLLADNLGYLDPLRDLGRGTAGLGFLADFEAWSLIFFGAGVIILLEVLVRLLVPAYRKPVGGTLIFGLVLIGIGLGDVFGWTIIWPLILIGLGLSILLRGVMRNR
jgi:low affinity Fe/Cu permease